MSLSVQGRVTCGLALAVTLGACANFSPDSGMAGLRELTGPLAADVHRERTLADTAEANAAVKRLLSKTLSADSAVRIALLNNRELQAIYAELGVAEAVKVGASLPPNPKLSVSYTGASGAFEFERHVAVDIVAIATLPLRAEIAEKRFRQAQLRAASETLRVAFEARRAFFRAVAANESASFLARSVEAAGNAVELSKSLGETGAINKLDQSRNLVFHAELGAQLGTASQRAASAREQLVRALGLWGGDLGFKLPSSLPALPGRPHLLAAIEREAVARRLDLQIARLDVEALAKSYGLTNATRFINVLDASAAAKTVQEPGGSRVRETGGGVELEIPIFDFGEVRVREAEATYQQAVNILLAKAVRIRSEAREAYLGYRASYDIARQYRSEVLPLRKIISDETLLRYNAMQVDVFTLLVEAREQIASTSAAIDALRDFWIADTDLGAAVVGGMSVETGETAQSGLAASQSTAAPGHD